MRAIPKSAGRTPLGLVTVLLCLACAVAGDEGLSHSPADIVRRAVENEIASNNSSGQHFMFKDEKKTPQASETKLMVETRDATAGLLVMRNGQALTPQQQRDEDARLAAYVQNPQELRNNPRSQPSAR